MIVDSKATIGLVYLSPFLTLRISSEYFKSNYIFLKIIYKCFHLILSIILYLRIFINPESESIISIDANYLYNSGL